MEVPEYSPSFLKIFSHFASRNYRGKLAPESRCIFVKRAVDGGKIEKNKEKTQLFSVTYSCLFDAL